MAFSTPNLRLWGTFSEPRSRHLRHTPICKNCQLLYWLRQHHKAHAISVDPAVAPVSSISAAVCLLRSNPQLAGIAFGITFSVPLLPNTLGCERSRIPQAREWLRARLTLRATWRIRQGGSAVAPGPIATC